MKQHTHSNNGQTFLFQEIDDERSAFSTYVREDGHTVLEEDPGQWIPSSTILPAGEWQIVGPASSLTEEQAQSITPPIHGYFMKYTREYWETEIKKHSGCTSSVDSLRSLLEAIPLNPDTTIVLKKI